MSDRHIIKIWKESSYGTFANPGSPVKGTDYIVIKLTEDNGFTLRAKPKQEFIRGQSFRNRRSQLVQTQTAVEGNLSTILYPEQTQFLLDMIAKQNAGQ